MLSTLMSGPRLLRAPPLDLYVSTSGSDSVGLGTSGSPWATVEGARLGIRARGLAGTDLLVHVEPGIYRGPVAFETGDSGLGLNRVRFAGVGQPGSAIVRASRVVTGWTSVGGGIYKAFIGAPVYTLWEDGVRARAARFPKYSPSATYPSARADYLLTTGSTGSHTVLQYGVGELSPGDWDLDAYGVSIVIWSGAVFDWFTDTVPLASVNAGARELTLSQQTRYQMFDGSTGSRYFAQGDISMLTEPGEFAYNKLTGDLYYLPIGDIGSVTIEIPMAQRAVSFVGSSEASPVRNISFEGISIEQSDFVDWYRHAHVNDGDSGEGHTWPSYDRQMTLPLARQGLVYLENAVGIRLDQCRLKNAGMHGIYEFGLNQGHVFSNILAENIGHTAAYIDGRYPGEGDVSFGHTFYNWRAHDCGELVGHGGGIVLANSGGHVVRNVEIYNVPRWALAIYAYTGITPSQLYARANRISHAKMHDICLNSSDTAALYFFGLPGCTNAADQCTIDKSNAHPSATNVPPDGVFLDNEAGGETGQTLSNCNVTNVQGQPFRAAEAGHTITNCSWAGGFNAAQMDPAIDVTPSFPTFA
jgi:hypothetical protein